jgi:hypothetical protein
MAFLRSPERECDFIGQRSVDFGRTERALLDEVARAGAQPEGST